MSITSSFCIIRVLNNIIKFQSVTVTQLKIECAQNYKVENGNLIAFCWFSDSLKKLKP